MAELIGTASVTKRFFNTQIKKAPAVKGAFFI